MSHVNRRPDIKICNDISAAIGDIVRYSINEEFQNNCLEALKVDCTKSLEEEINKKLKKICGINPEPAAATATLKTVTPIKLAGATYTSSPTLKRKIEDSTPEKMTRNKNWLRAATQQTRSTLIRRSSSNYPGSSEKETMVSTIWSQPMESTNKLQPTGNFETIGRSSISQLMRSPCVSRQSPRQCHFTLSALANTPSKGQEHSLFHDRRADVPEGTRKALFFDQSKDNSPFFN